MEQFDTRTHFASKKDVSFLKPHNKRDECDQISIFDATNYFNGLHDKQQQQQQQQSTKELEVTHIPQSYRTRSFNATPTASEASWNSQADLLSNPPGSVGVNLNIIKSFSNDSIEISQGGISKSNVSPKWPRISTKWLTRGRKCPCSGKKAVQVDERIDSMTTLPRMIGLRRSTSSNGTSNSFYSPRQNTRTNLPFYPRDHENSNLNLMVKSMNGEFSSSGLNCKEVGSLRLYDDLAKVNKGDIVTSTTNADADADVTTANNNAFTFPILENRPIGLHKMFNVIPNCNQTNDDPHRDSLETFQPRSRHSSPKSRRTSYEDENASDGSSDLFEIESFSTTPYRNSIDEVVVPN